MTLLSPVDGNRKTVQGDIIGIEGGAGIAGEPGGDLVTLDDKKSGRVTFPFSDIHSAKLVLTDRLIAATRPLDMSGSEEEVFGGADEVLGSDDEPGDILEEQED